MRGRTGGERRVEFSHRLRPTSSAGFELGGLLCASLHAPPVKDPEMRLRRQTKEREREREKREKRRKKAAAQFKTEGGGLTLRCFRIPTSIPIYHHENVSLVPSPLRSILPFVQGGREKPTPAFLACATRETGSEKLRVATSL